MTDLERLQRYAPKILILGILKKEKALSSVLCGSWEEFEKELEKYEEENIRLFTLKEHPPADLIKVLGIKRPVVGGASATRAD